MAGKKPDYIVKFPVRETKGNGQNQEVKEVWHRLGAAWVHENETGTIGITLDVGVPIVFPPGAQLVLVPPPQDGMDANDNHSADAVRQADWTGVKNARDFSEHYLKVSERRQDLKGERWGKALAAYARENPNRSDTGENRPLILEISGALHAWASNYDTDVEYFEFDPESFQKHRREPKPNS